MTNKFAFNPITGQLDLVTATVSPGDVTGGTPLTVAGFDTTGALESIPNWSIYPDTGGININLPFNFNGLTNTDVAHNLYTQIIPLQASPDERILGLNLALDFDPTSTGFNIGTAGNAGTLLNLNLTHQGTANTGDLVFISNYASLGNGTDPISINGLTYSYGFTDINSNVTITAPIQGYSFQPHVHSGATLSSNTYIKGFSDNSNIEAAVSGYESVQLGPNITSIANNYNYSGISLNANVTTLTGNAGYTGIGVFGNIGTLNTGNYQGITVSPTITTVATPGDYIAGLNISMGSVDATASNVFSINTNNGRVSFNNKTLNGQSGFSTQQTMDTQIDGAPGFVFGLNQFGGDLHIASGFPINSGQFGIGNNMGIGVFAEDDMLVDASGLDIGFVMNGFLTQVGVAAGKTFHKLTFMGAGASVPPGSNGGTFTSTSMFRALGILPQGGTVAIGEMVGFLGESTLSAMNPTSTWGIRIDDPNAENYFDKSLAIGTTTKKVSSAGTGLEIKTKDLVVDGGDQYITAMSANGVVTNSAAGKLISVAPGATGNVLTSTGTAWVSAAATGGSPAAPTSVKTANYTILSTDGTVLVDSSGGTFTVTFPASPVAGQVVKLKKVDASLIPVALSGPATGSMNTLGEFRAYEYDGTNWFLTTWNSDTEFTIYTPATLDGVGSPTAVNIGYSRNGKMLRVTGLLTTSTPGAQEIRLGLPGAIVVSTLLTDYTLVGNIVRGTNSAADTMATCIAITGNNYVQVGGLISGGSSSGQNPLVPQIGSDVFNSTEKESFYFEVPIFGWEP